MIDKFSDLPNTRQALNIYINYGLNEIKRYGRKINKIEENISEARRRLSVNQEPILGVINEH